MMDARRAMVLLLLFVCCVVLLLVGFSSYNTLSKNAAEQQALREANWRNKLQLSGRPSRALVVAQHSESIVWLYKIRDFRGSIIVYNKGTSEWTFNTSRTAPDSNYVIRKVANRGRESATYLQYIIDNYENLPEQIWFTQADPFVHHPDFLNFFDRSRYHLYTGLNFYSLSKQWKVEDNIPPQRFVKINNAFARGDALHHVNGILYTINKDNLQHVGHSRITPDSEPEWSARWYRKRYKLARLSQHQRSVLDSLSTRVGITPPAHAYVLYSYGASFFVQRAGVLRHPRVVYERLLDFLVNDDAKTKSMVHVGPRKKNGSKSIDPTQGYVLERFWHYLFTGESYESLAGCYDAMIPVLQRPIVAVYSNSQSRVWVRQLAAGSEAMEDMEATTLFMTGGAVRFLPGIDYSILEEGVGKLLHDQECKDLAEAKRVYLSILEFTRSA